MLHESLKGSIAEYKDFKKKTAKVEQKYIFRWKLSALGLSIVLIGLIGLLSTLIRSISALKSYDTEMSYLPDLLSKTTELNSVHQIQQIILALQKSGKKIYFTNANLLYGGSLLNSMNIVKTINQKSNLIYLFYGNGGTSKFGLYVDDEYDPNTKIGNEIVVGNSENSVIFNLGQPRNFNYAKCPIYRLKADNTLLIFESIQIAPTDSQLFTINLTNQTCFAGDGGSGMEMFQMLTNLVTGVYQIDRIQIFQLTL